MASTRPGHMPHALPCMLSQRAALLHCPPRAAVAAATPTQRLDPRWACDHVTSQPGTTCSPSCKTKGSGQQKANATHMHMREQPARAALAPNHTPTALHTLATLLHSHCPPHCTLGGSDAAANPHASMLWALPGQQPCLQAVAALALLQRCLCWVRCCGLCVGALQACTSSRAAGVGAAEEEEPAHCVRYAARSQRGEQPATVNQCCSKRLPYCPLPPTLLAAYRLCCARALP